MIKLLVGNYKVNLTKCVLCGDGQKVHRNYFSSEK